MVQDDLAKAFIESSSFLWKKEPEFTLSSGRKSPYYVNCKSFLSHPHNRELVGRLISARLKPLLHEIDIIGGMAIGAIPIATIASDMVFRETKKALRTFAVRKDGAKGHGLHLSIEGDIVRGDRAVVVDDVLTTGQSTADAIFEMKEAGVEVKFALVIVDRGEDNGKAKIESDGIQLLSLLTLEGLKRKYQEMSPSDAPLLHV